ncbi:ABC transporter substrate-binding protein [Halomonas sp. ML-15]|uniref:ABC transporter substrate-binding protein n=1 Tax=Halomonas sp. ML-15 TaxID=2773305 RepID=UPI0017473117|nr:ABC transporter substrate-binding protein [Halomonas sp. ML-15]MBD3896843.1 ABC transporter substrate-binding protein [Halomonas sp. ML-15]
MSLSRLFATTLALSLSGALAAAEPVGIASFDLGSLDSLDALGLSEHVVGVPQQNLPRYLAHFDDTAYVDIGGLRSPDLATLSELAPGLILITGRQGEWRDELEGIATVMDTRLAGDDYLASFDRNVLALAERLNASEAAEQALTALHAHIDQRRQALAEAPSSLVVTHNQGNFTLNRHPVVHQVLDVAAPTLPASVTSETRGNRVFTPLPTDAIAEIAPEVLLIIDRSAAIGDDAINIDAAQETLAAAGAEGIRIEILSPALWYLSGGGLQSLRLQVEEVVAALQP